AAENPVGGRERNALRGGLERRSAGVVNGGVVAEQAHRRDVGSGFESVRHGAGQTLSTGEGDAVHVRRVRSFDRRFSAQLLQRFVGGAVGNDDRVLHTLIPKKFRYSCSGWFCLKAIATMSSRVSATATSGKPAAAIILRSDSAVNPVLCE